MRKTMLGLVLAALMTAGLGSAAWAEPAPVVQYPASAVEAVAAGSDYTYEELLACLTGAGCTEAEALAYAGEPVEAPEGAMVRYSLLRVEDYDGTEDLPVRCLVLAALEYAPGEPVPRSILALRSPMALTGDGSAFEGQVFAALYSGRNFTCIVSGNSLPEEDTLWTGTDWIGIDGNGEGYALGGEPIPDSLVRAGEAGKAASPPSLRADLNIHSFIHLQYTSTLEIFTNFGLFLRD